MPYGILINDAPFLMKGTATTASWGTRDQAQAASDSMTIATAPALGQVRSMFFRPFLIPDDLPSQKTTSANIADFTYVVPETGLAL